MAFVTPKNMFAPITNKTLLFLLIFFTILFAMVRQSGGKITVEKVKTNQVIPQHQVAAVPQPKQVAIPNDQAPGDSFLPFDFNELKPQKPTNAKEDLNDILKQLN